MRKASERCLDLAELSSAPLPALTALSGWAMKSKRSLDGARLVSAPQNPGLGAGPTREPHTSTINLHFLGRLPAGPHSTATGMAFIPSE